MAQFDVYGNPFRSARAIPYVISLQNARLDHVTTRFVAALVLRSAVVVYADYLSPTFDIAGRELVLDLFNLTTVPVSRLGPVVATLADEQSRAKLVRAMDEFLSQA